MYRQPPPPPPPRRQQPPIAHAVRIIDNGNDVETGLHQRSYNDLRDKLEIHFSQNIAALRSMNYNGTGPSDFPKRNYAAPVLVEFDQPGPRLVTKRRRILYVLAAIVAVIIMVTLVLFGLRNYIWSTGSAEKEDTETPYTTVSLPSVPVDDSSPRFIFGAQCETDVVPMFKDLKEEILQNPFATDDFTSFPQRNRDFYGPWMKELKENGIGLDHLIALKLYTDFNDPQKELRKSYRTPFCENEDRVRAFARWRDLLEDAFIKLNVVLQEHDQPKLLCHGIDATMPITRFSGIYYGPTSTTTDLSKARDFARDNGMILVLKPKPSKYKMVSIDWLSKYNENEFLIFDQEVEVQSVVLSSDYDQHKAYYHKALDKAEDDGSDSWTTIPTDNEGDDGHSDQSVQSISTPTGHVSYDDQTRVVSHFVNLNKLTSESVLDFRSGSVAKAERMSLMQWMVDVISTEITDELPGSEEYKQNVRDNLQSLLRDVKKIKIPDGMMEKLAMNKDTFRAMITTFISDR